MQTRKPDKPSEFKVTFDISDGGDITLAAHNDAPQGGDFTFLTPARPLSPSKVVMSTLVAQEEEDMSQCAASSQPLPESEPPEQPLLSASQPPVTTKPKLSRKPQMKGVDLQGDRNVTDRKRRAPPLQKIAIATVLVLETRT